MFYIYVCACVYLRAPHVCRSPRRPEEGLSKPPEEESQFVSHHLLAGNWTLSLLSSPGKRYIDEGLSGARTGGGGQKRVTANRFLLRVKEASWIQRQCCFPNSEPLRCLPSYGGILWNGAIILLELFITKRNLIPGPNPWGNHSLSGWGALCAKRLGILVGFWTDLNILTSNLKESVLTLREEWRPARERTETWSWRAAEERRERKEN